MKLPSYAASVILALTVSLGAAAARADTLYSFAGPTAEMPSPAFVDATFTAGAGAGSVAFTVDGIDTIDGQNCCTDTFTLSLNGSAVLSGTWNLGGGGNNVVFLQPGGSTISASSPCIGCGGTLVITSPLSFLNGLNTLRFEYSGGFQGLGDEGWDLRDVTVTGSAFREGGGGSAPEPASWALMLVGFFGMGASLRRRAAAV